MQVCWVNCSISRTRHDQISHTQLIDWPHTRPTQAYSITPPSRESCAILTVPNPIASLIKRSRKRPISSRLIIYSRYFTVYICFSLGVRRLLYHVPITWAGARLSDPEGFQHSPSSGSEAHFLDMLNVFRAMEGFGEDSFGLRTITNDLHLHLKLPSDCNSNSARTPG